MKSSGPRSKIDLKIVVLGQGGVGKTSFINRYIHNDFAEMVSTIGASFVLKRWKSFYFCIWDTAGQERFTRISNFYCRGAHAAIIVFDITDRESFLALPNYQAYLKDATPGCMVIIIGTKLDMASEPDEFTSKSSQLFNSENVFDKSENEKNLKESSKSTDDADCKLEQIDSKSLIPPTITSKDPFAPEVENTESILNNSLYPNNFSKYTGESLNTPSSSSSSSQRPHRQVTSQEACDYALQSGAVYFETSAKENINVTKVFDLIGFQLLGSRIIEEKTVSVTTQIHSPSLPTIQKRDSSSCCTIS